MPRARLSVSLETAAFVRELAESTGLSPAEVIADATRVYNTILNAADGERRVLTTDADLGDIREIIIEVTDE